MPVHTLRVSSKQAVVMAVPGVLLLLPMSLVAGES